MTYVNYMEEKCRILNEKGCSSVGWRKQWLKGVRRGDKGLETVKHDSDSKEVIDDEERISCNRKEVAERKGTEGNVY